MRATSTGVIGVMRHVGVFVGVMAVIMAGLVLGAPTAYAHAASGSAHAVFIQTNNPAGNAIVAYERHANGTLTLAATYPTGGRGSRAGGSGSDSLASQGSLLFDSAGGLLFAVNAGSDTVSVFRVHGDTLRLNQVISSGGAFPVSLARHGSLLYALNAGLDGAVSGFRIANGELIALKGSTRSLRLANTNPPNFLFSPAEVGFTPSGSQLVVTTKSNGLVDVFSVNPRGLPTGHPVSTAVGGVPFAFRFDAAGHLELVNTGDSSLGVYSISRHGALRAVSAPVDDTQAAACWITRVHGFDYVANTGSGTISQYGVSGAGTVTLVQAVAASGIAGAIDLATAGGVLYDQAGLAASVEVYAVGSHGALTLIQTAPVPDGASQEGIVAI